MISTAMLILGIDRALDTVRDAVVDSAKDAFMDVLLFIWGNIKEGLLVASYSIVLIGGAICVILYVAGWGKGIKAMGIIFVCYVLLRAILL